MKKNKISLVSFIKNHELHALQFQIYLNANVQKSTRSSNNAARIIVHDRKLSIHTIATNNYGCLQSGEFPQHFYKFQSLQGQLSSRRQNQCSFMPGEFSISQRGSRKHAVFPLPVRVIATLSLPSIQRNDLLNKFN